VLRESHGICPCAMYCGAGGRSAGDFQDATQLSPKSRKSRNKFGIGSRAGLQESTVCSKAFNAQHALDLTQDAADTHDGTNGLAPARPQGAAER